MRRTRIPTAIVLSLVAASCSSPEAPEVERADISGTYSGPIDGSSAMETFSGTLRIALAQSGDELRGTYELNGMLTGGVADVPVDQSGAVIGVVDLPGQRPLFTLSLYAPACADHGFTVTGGSDSPGEYLVLSGGTLVACGDIFSHSFTITADTLRFE